MKHGLDLIKKVYIKQSFRLHYVKRYPRNMTCSRYCTLNKMQTQEAFKSRRSQPEQRLSSAFNCEIWSSETAENEQALATKGHGGLRSMRGKTKPLFQKEKIEQKRDKSINQSSAGSQSWEGLHRLGNCACVNKGITDHRSADRKGAISVGALFM